MSFLIPLSAKISKSYLHYFGIFVIISIYIIFSPAKSDYDVYSTYYSNINIANFYKYSFGLGWQSYVLFFRMLNVSFILFWKITNVISCILFCYFLVPRKNRLNFPALFFLFFLLFFPLSVNLFSNVVRQTFSVAICLYLIKIKAKPYFFFIPLLIHVSSIVLILSYAADHLFRRRHCYPLFLCFLLILPLLSIVSANLSVAFLDNFQYLRFAGNTLASVYTPAYRYLGFITYLVTTILSFLILRFDLYYQELNVVKLRFFSYIDLSNASILVTWFSFSLFLYWSFIGLGDSARILTQPLWISCYLLFYFCTYSLIKYVNIIFSR